MKKQPNKKAAVKNPKAKPAASDTAKGWACPCCPRVHAPTVKECHCRKEAMFGLTTGPIQDHERTEADEAAERTRQMCNKLPFEELMQEPIREPPEETNGTRIARENRTACNNLTKEERSALLEEAMRMIEAEKPADDHG